MSAGNLPPRRADANEIRDASLRAEAMNQSRGRPQPSVLLVEDDPRARRALAAILKGWGCAVRTAETAEQGIALLTAAPNLVVLDLMLPDVSGVEVLRHIRNERIDALVAVVSGAKDEVQEEAKALRPDACFEKPISLLKLNQWLATGPLAVHLNLPSASSG